jgi:hypothetical protein
MWSSRLFDTDLDHPVMFGIRQRRGLARGAAGDQPLAAIVDLPVDELAERGFIERSVAKRSRQSWNRA